MFSTFWFDSHKYDLTVYKEINNTNIRDRNGHWEISEREAHWWFQLHDFSEIISESSSCLVSRAFVTNGFVVSHIPGCLQLSERSGDGIKVHLINLALIHIEYAWW